MIRHGFPPVVIKSATKNEYLNALRLADVGDMASFVNYIADQEIWSLNMAIKAAKGESIDEVGDLDKKLDMLLKQESLKSNFAGKYSLEKVYRTHRYTFFISACFSAVFWEIGQAQFQNPAIFRS